MEKENWKNRRKVVYSTNPEYQYQYEKKEEKDTLPPAEQTLVVHLDRKGRKGKTATLVRGFVGKTSDLEVLGRKLKTICATGGTVRDGEILIQGDFRKKIADQLSKEGYKIKFSGG
jgi:translation initiation factor 1